MQKFSPPRSLSAEARILWAQLREDYTIDDAAGLALLRVALEAFDRMRQAQALIAKHGVCITDRFGVPKMHPAVIVERDARSGMLAALKALRLDLEAIGPIGRPPGQ